jgi:hypothetical protein
MADHDENCERLNQGHAFCGCNLVCAWCGKQEIECEAARNGFEIDLVPRDEYERGRPACLRS